jgi:tRNA-specific 2-thiouridylase
MSGGVDSSVAAALLLENGCDVIGVTIRLRACQEAARSRSCCGLDGILHARQVAGRLGIPHYVLDWHRAFEELVLWPSWKEYASGRTPNPCVGCNQQIKFGLLANHAKTLGAQQVATGHYARIQPAAGSSGPALLRGRDASKDQSYFLFSLSARQLSTACLPLGELNKQEVRVIAKWLGLPNAQRAESQDACLGDNGLSFAESLRRRFDEPTRSGTVVDEDGRVVGSHSGIHNFTVGQRRGLGIALGKQAWVKELDAGQAQVVLTTDEKELLSQGLIAENFLWSPAVEFRGSMRCQVQIRYGHRPVNAFVQTGCGSSAKIVFDRPQRAVTPGQAAVLYDGERLIGGGWIKESLREKHE